MMFVPRGLTGYSLGTTPAGVVVARGPTGEEIISPGRLEPLCWDWNETYRVLAVQLLCGANMRSTRVTSGEIGPGRKTRQREIAGDLYQLLRVLPRVAVMSDAGSRTGDNLIDPSGLLVLAGAGLVWSPEGLGRLDGVLSTAARPRSELSPIGQAAFVDASIWSDAHVSSWRRAQVSFFGKRVDAVIKEEERLWGVTCPVNYIEDPDNGAAGPEVISISTRHDLAGLQDHADESPEAAAALAKASVKKPRRLVGFMAPTSGNTVVGGAAKKVDPGLYGATSGVGFNVRWSPVIDLDLADVLGSDEPPPFPPVPPNPPNPPPPFPPNPPNPPPGPWNPPLEPLDPNPPKPPKPPVPPPPDDLPHPPLDNDHQQQQDDDDEAKEGAQAREPFADDTGSTTTTREQTGTAEPHDGVFVSTSTPIGTIITVNPAAAIADEATRTPKESVGCPLVDPGTAPPHIELSTGGDSDTIRPDGTNPHEPKWANVVVSPDGIQTPIRVPTGAVGATTTQDRQAVVDAALPFAPLAAPGSIGSALTPWGAIRQLVQKVNSVIGIVGSAFVGGRYSYYRGNLAVISDQPARNIIGRHLVNPNTDDDGAPVQPGLNVYQAVTSTNRTASVDRPAQTTTRALRGDVTATAPVLRLEKRTDQGATDTTPWVDAGNGKFSVLDGGQTNSPGAELRPTTDDPIREDASGLSVNEDGELCYSTGGVRTPLTSSGAPSGSSGAVGYPIGNSFDAPWPNNYDSQNALSWGPWNRSQGTGVYDANQADGEANRFFFANEVQAGRYGRYMEVSFNRSGGSFNLAFDGGPSLPMGFSGWGEGGISVQTKVVGYSAGVPAAFAGGTSILLTLTVHNPADGTTAITKTRPITASDADYVTTTIDKATLDAANFQPGDCLRVSVDFSVTVNGGAGASTMLTKIGRIAADY